MRLGLCRIVDVILQWQKLHSSRLTLWMSGSTIILGQKIVLPSFFQRSDFYYKMKKNLPTARFSVNYRYYYYFCRSSIHSTYSIPSILHNESASQTEKKSIETCLLPFPTPQNVDLCPLRLLTRALDSISLWWIWPSNRARERPTTNSFFNNSVGRHKAD